MRINTKNGRWWLDVFKGADELFTIRQWPENLLVSSHRTKERAVERAQKLAAKLDRKP